MLSKFRIILFFTVVKKVSLRYLFSALGKKNQLFFTVFLWSENAGSVCVCVFHEVLFDGRLFNSVNVACLKESRCQGGSCRFIDREFTKETNVNVKEEVHYKVPTGQSLFSLLLAQLTYS
jgi:hypothetical protein